MTPQDQEPHARQAPVARLSIDQVGQALTGAEHWDAAGAVIFEAVRHIRVLDDANEQAALLTKVEACCLRLLSAYGTEGIAPEVLYLPPLTLKVKRFSQNREQWAEQFSKALTSQKQSEFEWHDDHLVALLTVEGMAQSPGQALGDFLDALATIEQLHTSDQINLKRMGGRLFNTAWFDVEEQKVIEGIHRLAKCVQEYNYPTAYIVLSNTLKALDLLDAPIWISKVMAEVLIFPFFKRLPTAMEHTKFALQLELVVYTQYLKKIDTKSHFEFCYQAMKPTLEQCGILLATGSLPLLPSPTSAPPKVAFLLHSSGYLAHARNYITFLKGLRELDTPPIEPITIVNGTQTEDAAESLPKEITELGSPVRWIDLGAGDVPDYLAGIRDQCARDEVSALVFVSTPTFLISSAKARLAPRIIWWAMKYHALECDGIDGYVTYGSFGKERVIDGRTWKSTFPALTDLYDPEASEEAEIIRKKLRESGFDCILACIGREEKINHRPYLETIQSLLTRNPKSVFLWTGRSIPPEVKQILEDLGISDRCHFVGWVDTKVYAQVIDIYADSFPFASGYTAYEAMAAGKPVVVLETPESLESSSATMLLPVLNQDSGSPEDQDRIRDIFSEKDKDLAYSPFVKTTDAYEEKVTRLMNDLSYRAKSGEAGRQLFNEFLGNRKKMTENICAHILDIIENDS
jgi:glycosyltransferase involved in cell wall biosynthesis